MRLIIDAGSTKMEWILSEGSVVRQRFVTAGFNPNYSDRKDFIEMCRGVSLPNEIQSVYYYGTGCGNEQNCQIIRKVFQNRFPNAEIHVAHDLMAACHAVLGQNEGIACILGTGSNACVYNGNDIVEKAVSLGYLVGDEGSGMHIGREVVRAYYYGFMPEKLGRQFAATYQLTLGDFIQELYHGGQPSRYLASFAKFAGEHQDEPFIHDLVKGNFKAFVEAFVLRFEGCKAMRVSFVGSVAYHFHGILRECLDEYGLTMGEVMQTPAEGLIRYYQNLPA